MLEGYGITGAIDYTTPDGEMIRHLQTDCYKFSAAESYTMNKQLTSLLIGNDNKVRSFEEWRQEATKLTKTWVNDWARTEYDTAIAGGQMASKWVAFEEEAESMPYLRYDTVGDSRVRDSHKLLDRIVKEIDNHFWKTYYPPNGWKCRCSVTQLPNKAHAAPDKDITYPEIPDIFKVNLAQRQLIYPPDHPYYQGPSEKKLNKWVNKNLPDAK